MGLLAVEFTVDQLEMFFKRCEAANAVTEKEKQVILMEMIKEGECKRAFTTQRTKEEFKSDMQKNVGNVLDLTTKETEETNGK
jgi:hypothetical protein